MVDLKLGEVLLVNKPLDWTSFDVVSKIRNLFHLKKVGHAGTLDPKATGLLIICTGTRTKRISEFTDLDKEYVGVMELGAVTPSGDTETHVSERRSLESVTEIQIRELTREFAGQIEQIPPMHSAVKFKGKPLYKIARKGKTVERKPRKVEIKEFEITETDLPDVSFRVLCSKGTYIRALVTDFGDRLGCGAYLKSLVRTRIGGFSVQDALSLRELEESARLRSTTAINESTLSSKRH
jgi:tRNA pseudouridine55 synthase